MSLPEPNWFAGIAAALIFGLLLAWGAAMSWLHKQREDFDDATPGPDPEGSGLWID